MGKLVSLEELDISGNALSLLRDVDTLGRGLRNLTTMQARGNPFCDLPHYREYVEEEPI